MEGHEHTIRGRDEMANAFATLDSRKTPGVVSVQCRLSSLGTATERRKVRRKTYEDRNVSTRKKNQKPRLSSSWRQSGATEFHNTRSSSPGQT